MEIFGGIFEIEDKEKRIKEIEKEMSSPDFWNDKDNVANLTKELKLLKNYVKKWTDYKNDLEDLFELVGLSKDENDESLTKEYETMLSELSKRYEELEFSLMLNEENDKCSSYMSINAGAGGTEACDWVSMLYRMYSRWCERKGYEIEVVDVLYGDEAGIKNITFKVIGDYAFGYLKTETGIHRLVRISPFDSNARRHTSFASVFNLPEIDSSIEIDINPSDIRIDTYRSTGAGGQHVNKTDSAVRITHFPTGIVVQCQNERSQHKNKEKAFQYLRARLYEHYQEEQEKQKQKEENKKKDIGWGNQIRSYIFQPYTLVKDHRTNIEIGNINAVMDGEIDEFIVGFLKNAKNN